MKITYDNFGRVSEVKFDDGENQELGFKAFETLVKEQAAANKYAVDKNVEATTRVLEYNYAMASLRFNVPLKPCNVDDGGPNKDIALTT